MKVVALPILLAAGLLTGTSPAPAAQWDYDTPAEARINQATMEMLGAVAERFHRQFDNSAGVDTLPRFDQARLRAEVTALESRFTNDVTTSEERHQQAVLERIRLNLAERVDRYEQLISERFVELVRDDPDAWQHRLVEQAIRLDYFAVPAALLSDRPEHADALARYDRLRQTFEELHREHIR